MGKAMYTKRVSVHLLGCLVLAMTVLKVVPEARADDEPRTQIEKLATKAMENFDALEYETARKLLSKALVLAESNGLEQDPVVARVHLDLGIIFFSGDSKDVDSARLEFIKAVKIDANIEIDAVYSTPEMRDLLSEVRDKYGDFTPKVDCANASGLAHALIDAMPAGQDRVFQATVGSDIDATKVSLHYRMLDDKGTRTSFKELEMARSKSGCEYSTSLPGARIVAGQIIHYYVAAYDRRGRIVASKGSEGSPNIIEVVAPGGDGDEPPPGLDDGTVVAQKARYFVAALPGTGGAFVTGRTEQKDSPINCCFAPALLHFWLEAGYYLSPRMSVSLATRLGLPIGANLDMHARLGPAGFARLRYSKSETGEGLVLSAVLGFGSMRQTIKLQDVETVGMDTDITTVGPLLFGGGVAYVRSVGGPVRLAAGADLTAGIPIVKTIGTARYNFGVQVDVNLGIMVAF